MDQIWDMEKMNRGIIKILGLKPGNIRMRLNSCPGKAQSTEGSQVEEYLLSRSKCYGSSLCRIPWRKLGLAEEVW